MTRTGAGSYAMLTDNSSNWNTAHGWGNHASAGYLTDLLLDTTPQLGGNLDGQAFNITTTGKLSYANAYANTGSFPSAGTYNGMFLVDSSSGYP